MSYFNDEQQAYMKYLGSLGAKEKCWCGWDLFGKCYNCNRHEVLKDLTLADKLPLRCLECGNSPGVPGQTLVHIRGCRNGE